MYAKGYPFEIISEIGSRVDYNRKKLNQLIYYITNSEIEKIVVLNKETLLTIFQHNLGEKKIKKEMKI